MEKENKSTKSLSLNKKPDRDDSDKNNYHSSRSRHDNKDLREELNSKRQKRVSRSKSPSKKHKRRRSRSRSRSRSKSLQRRYKDSKKYERTSRSKSPSRKHRQKSSRSRSKSPKRGYKDSRRYGRNRSRSRSRSDSRYKPKYDKKSSNNNYQRSGSERFKNNRHIANKNGGGYGNSLNRDIFQVLTETRREISTYLNSVFLCDTKPDEIFMRWYFNSFSGDVKDYFIPKNFRALENDLDYYKEKMRLKVCKQDIICKVENIWQSIEKKEYTLETNVNPNEITDQQEKRLKKLFTGKDEEYEKCKNLLISAYKFLGNKNNHLSFPPKVFEGMDVVELFGSPLNTSYSYCSPFKLEKERFSSNGSFFEYEIKPGINIANPPFDETLMEAMVDRLEAQLDKTEGINIVCIIPVWDPESQARYGLKEFGKEFVAFNKILKSKYYHDRFYLDKYMYPFWQYFVQRYTPASATHFIILKRKDDKLLFEPEEILEKWRSLAK